MHDIAKVVLVVIVPGEVNVVHLSLIEHTTQLLVELGATLLRVGLNVVVLAVDWLDDQQRRYPQLLANRKEQPQVAKLCFTPARKCSPS